MSSGARKGWNHTYSYIALERDTESWVDQHSLDGIPSSNCCRAWGGQGFWKDFLCFLSCLFLQQTVTACVNNLKRLSTLLKISLLKMLKAAMLTLSPELWQDKVSFNFTWQELMIALFLDSSFEHYRNCNPRLQLYFTTRSSTGSKNCRGKDRKSHRCGSGLWCPRFPLSILTIAR